MSQATHFQNIQQFPLNSMGPGGQHASVGMNTIVFKGTTGLVGTSFGIPGFGATRISTGAYNLFFPKSKSVHILPSLNAPSGVFMNFNISDIEPYSGTAKLQITRDFAVMGSGFPSGGNHVPSLTRMPYNPPSGTKLDLLVFNQPVRGY